MTIIFKSLSKFIKILANDTRLLILYFIKEKPHSINSLKKELKERKGISISQPALSKQLKILIEASLIKQIKENNVNLYQIYTDKIFSILQGIKNLYIELQEEDMKKIDQIKSQDIFSID